MVKSESEIWRAHPDIPGIEVSTLGRVRTLDRVVPCRGNGTRLVKGHISKQYVNADGYLQVSIPVDGRWNMKSVHRLVAKIFIPNQNNLPEVNHKDSDRANNNVSNLEWCSHSYNIQYREKFGISATESQGHPLFAINLKTAEVSRFPSQNKASKALEVSQGNIYSIIKGNRNQTGGYWFTNADEKADDLIKRKLEEV